MDPVPFLSRTLPREEKTADAQATVILGKRDAFLGTFCLVTWLSQTVIQLFPSFWMESSMSTWRAGAISSIISVPPMVAGRDLHTNMAIESESVGCSVMSDSL